MYKKSYLLIISLILILFGFTHASSPINTSKRNWTVKKLYNDAFIENLGQFKQEDFLSSEEILYVTKQDGYQIIFTPSGFSYVFSEINEERQAYLLKEFQEEQEEKKYISSLPIQEQKMLREREFLKERELKAINIYDKKNINIIWNNASPNATIQAEHQDGVSYNYSASTYASSKSVVGNPVNIKAKGYKQLTYQNLYPNIDILFSFHPNGGIKYDIIVHPGGNINDISMVYDEATNIEIAEGNLLFGKGMLNMQDQAPETYQNTSSGKVMIPSNFIVNGNMVKFDIGTYNSNLDLIIDPWQSPTNFSGANNLGLHIKADNAGNVYVYGGGSNGVNIEVRKFTPTGALDWVYTPTWGNAGGYDWFGSLEVNKSAGVCYISTGYSKIQRVFANGTMDWERQYGIADFIEPWSLTYDCRSERMLLGGTGNGISQGAIATIDTLNGNIIETGNLSFAGEIRALAPSPLGGFFVLGLNNLGHMCPDLREYYSLNHTHQFDYWGPVFDRVTTPGTNSGIAGDTSYIYASNGDSITQWDIKNGTFVKAIKIPGGVREESSGLLVDDCGNVYAGSNLGVFKYDNTLTFIDSVSFENGVHDIDFGQGGEIVATGVGYAASVDLASCGAYTFCFIDSCDPIPSGGSDTTICAGDTLELRASDGTIQLLTFYSWAPATNIDSPNAQSVKVYPTTTTTYIATVTTFPFSVTRDTFKIEVQNPPSIFPPTPRICPGDTVELTASDSMISWRPDYNLSADTGNVVKAFPDSTTTYFAFAGDDSTCAASVKVVTGLIFTPVGANICAGDTVTLNAIGADSIIWTPNYNLVNDTGVSVEAFPDTTIIYTASKIGDSTCSGNITVTVLDTLIATPAIDTICKNDSITITVSGFSNLVWQPNYNLSSSFGSVVEAFPDTTITYRIEYLSNSNCNTNVTIHVDSLVAIASKDQICEGDTVLLTTNGFIDSLIWSPNLNLSSNIGDSISAIPNNTITYTVAEQNNSSCNSSVAITVVNLVNSTICIGDTITLSPIGLDTVIWTPNYNLTSDTGVSVDAFPDTSTIYIASRVSDSLCSGYVSVTVVDTLLTNPISDSICKGDSLSLSAIGFTDLIWTPSSSLNTNVGQTVVAFPDTTTTYHVIYQPNSNCDAHIAIQVDSIIVTASEQQICFGDTILLTTNGIFDNLLWSPNHNLNSILGDSIYARPDTSIIYTVIDSNNLSCHNAIEILVTHIITDPSNVTICLGDTTALSASGADSLTWSPNNNLNIDTGISINAFPTATTTYTVATSIGGKICSAEVTVNVNDLPDVDYLVLPDSCISYRVLFSEETDLIQGCVWDFGDGTTSTICDPDKQYANGGDYTVRLTITDTNGCTDFEEKIISLTEKDACIAIPSAFSPTGINNVFKPVIFSVKELQYFRVFNRWGELLFETNDNSVGWDGTYQGIEQPVGIYIYEISGTDYSNEEILLKGGFTLIR